MGWWVDVGRRLGAGRGKELLCVGSMCLLSHYVECASQIIPQRMAREFGSYVMSVVDDDVFETCRLGVVEWERLKRCTESVCEKCFILIYHVPVHNTLNLTHLTTSGERGWAKQTTSSSSCYTCYLPARRSCKGLFMSKCVPCNNLPSLM